MGIALAVAAAVPTAWKRPAVAPVSRGSCISVDYSLQQDCAILSTGIDRYQHEHGGRLPPATDLARQLTLPTDADGHVLAATAAQPAGVGPYLRRLVVRAVDARGGQSAVVALGPDTHLLVYDEVQGTVAAYDALSAPAHGRFAWSPPPDRWRRLHRRR